MDIYDLVNGKVRCTAVKDHRCDFTVGGIYEVKDKCVMSNDGFAYAPACCRNGVEWLKPWDEFELVEDYDHKDGIKQVIFNDPATIILWHDGTKTVAKCCDGDKYDAEKGFCIAYLKKMLGAKQFSEELHKWVKDEEKPYKTRPPFNVGDKVKIVDHPTHYWAPPMYDYAGKVMTISHVYDGIYELKGAKCRLGFWAWDKEDFARD